MVCQTFNVDKIKQSLINLNCDVLDRGSYYHVKAKYREGDNPTALRVYKNSGVWKDFVEGSQYFPFEVLVSRILNTKDENVIKKYLSDDNISVTKNDYRKEIETKKIYDEKILKKLEKNYSFYNKKNISDNTLKIYKCGVGKENNFKNFFVFPIFNKFGKIHGFSGRNILYNPKNEKSLKWMHTKDVINFIYPYFLNDRFSDSTRENKEIYLIESIGDSLALSENRIYNHLVCFTTFINSKPLCFLSALNLEKIIFSFNNDSESSKNWGLINSVKNLIRASEVIPIEKLFIKQPEFGDFGDMQEQKASFSEWKNKKITQKENKEYILLLLTNKKFLSSLQLSKKNLETTKQKIRNIIDDPFISE